MGRPKKPQEQYEQQLYAAIQTDVSLFFAVDHGHAEERHFSEGKTEEDLRKYTVQRLVFDNVRAAGYFTDREKLEESIKKSAGLLSAEISDWQYSYLYESSEASDKEKKEAKKRYDEFEINITADDFIGKCINDSGKAYETKDFRIVLRRDIEGEGHALNFSAVTIYPVPMKADRIKYLEDKNITIGDITTAEAPEGYKQIHSAMKKTEFLAKTIFPHESYERRISVSGMNGKDPSLWHEPKVFINIPGKDKSHKYTACISNFYIQYRQDNAAISKNDFISLAEDGTKRKLDRLAEGCRNIFRHEHMNAERFIKNYKNDTYDRMAMNKQVLKTALSGAEKDIRNQNTIVININRDRMDHTKKREI